MLLTHPLDLHEIRSNIASHLDPIDLAACVLVSHDWNDSFTPQLYKTVILLKRGLCNESIERNKHHIQSLHVQRSACDDLSSTLLHDRLVLTVTASSSLTHLALDHNWIDDHRVQALADALWINTTLLALDLCHNPLGDDVIQALAEALKINTTLTILDLGSTSSGPEVALAFSEVLKINVTLRTLALDGNQIHDEGARALAEALKINSTLTSLSLQDNSIGPDGAQALSSALKTNSTLTTLDLESWTLFDAEECLCLNSIHDSG
ncbi:hypothetical protein BGZ68_001912, partial [Mortierella alpina]